VRRALLLLLLTGCDDTTFGSGADSLSEDGPSCDSQANSVTFVMQQLAFAEAEDGVVWGFDLDDHVSEVGDGGGCGKADQVDPEGTPGIDNAFATLFPAIENTEAAAVKDLMQNAVNAGELLMIFEVLGLDDPVDDDCVSVRFGLGQGSPLIGTDGYILDGQSFHRSSDVDPFTMTDAELIDGTLVASPFSADLELQVLDAPLAFAVADGSLRVDLHPELTSASGHFGGGFSTTYVMEVIDGNGVDDELTELLRTALPLAADLDGPDGECLSMSVAIEYTAVPAFFYD